MRTALVSLSALSIWVVVGVAAADAGDRIRTPVVSITRDAADLGQSASRDEGGYRDPRRYLGTLVGGHIGEPPGEGGLEPPPEGGLEPPPEGGLEPPPEGELEPPPEGELEPPPEGELPPEGDLGGVSCHTVDLGTAARGMGQRLGLEQAMRTSGYGGIVNWIHYHNAKGRTIAVGYDVDIALVHGGTTGVGVYFAPDYGFGTYSYIGVDIKTVTVSATLALTIINGGPDRLRGRALAIEATGGGRFVTGGTAYLFTMPPEYDFFGVSVAAGLGISPGLLSAFTSYADTAIVPLTEQEVARWCDPA